MLMPGPTHSLFECLLECLSYGDEFAFLDFSWGEHDSFVCQYVFASCLSCCCPVLGMRHQYVQQGHIVCVREQRSDSEYLCVCVCCVCARALYIHICVCARVLYVNIYIYVCASLCVYACMCT